MPKKVQESDNRKLGKKLNDPEYMGEEVDPKLKQGPVMKRKCTDCLCYIIFFAFVVGMFAAAGYGWLKGDVSKLLASWRTQKIACGHDLQKGFPFLYIIPNKPADSDITFSDLTNGSAQSYCVSSCPSQTSQPLSCSSNFPCPSVMASYSSKGLLGRFCTPVGDQFNSFKNSLDQVFFQGNLSSYIQDITQTWQVMLIVVGIAIVTGLIYLALVYCCAAPIIWLSIFGSIGASAFFGWYYWDRASAFADSADNSQTSYKALGITLWVVSGLVLIICCCCYDKIRLAVAVIRAAAQFVFQTKRILCHPIFLAIAIGLWYAVWLVGAVFIFSVGTLSKRDNYPIAQVEWDNTTRYAMLYYFFGLLWINAFFIAMFQFTIAVSAATWYFSYGTDDSGARVCKGICWGMGYHAGSLAFGSFLLALIWMIRIIFEYWRKKMESLAPGENKCMKCMVCMVRCCLDCLNRCIKFINRNAYIQIALTSKSFCFAAIDAFFLILRNIGRFGITHAVSAMFLFLGKVVIAGGSTFCGYLIVQHWVNEDDINNGFVPIIVFFLLSYVIATIILSVYGMAANTILQCFLLDEELNKHEGGANHRPPAMEGLVKEIKK